MPAFLGSRPRQWLMATTEDLECLLIDSYILVPACELLSSKVPSSSRKHLHKAFIGKLWGKSNLVQLAGP